MNMSTTKFYRILSFNDSQLAKFKKSIPLTVLPIIAKLSSKVRIVCTHITYITGIAQEILFLPNRFLIKYRFTFPIFLAQNHLALLKNRFLKKMLLKKSKNPVAFSSQN